MTSPELADAFKPHDIKIPLSVRGANGADTRAWVEETGSLFNLGFNPQLGPVHPLGSGIGGLNPYHFFRNSIVTRPDGYQIVVQTMGQRYNAETANYDQDEACAWYQTKAYLITPGLTGYDQIQPQSATIVSVLEPHKADAAHLQVSQEMIHLLKFGGSVRVIASTRHEPKSVGAKTK